MSHLISLMHQTLVYKTKVLSLLASMVMCLLLHAQPFKLMRYDEDYTRLADSSRKLYEKLKFIPLSTNKKLFLSFGGEIRYEYAAFKNEDWGRRGLGRNNFLLQRYNLHADLHFGKTCRVFGQLRSALEDGRKNGPRPIDEDRLNIQNLFVDLKLSLGINSLMMRAGRQELDYGSDRLISVREGPNVRFYFDGLKLVYQSKQFSIDGFIMEADSVFHGAFDNKHSRVLNFWGIYSSIALPTVKNIDVYYLGIKKSNVAYEEGINYELRNTIGVRIWGEENKWKYDIEAAYQFGTFGSRQISAYTLSFDAGYQFQIAKAKPFIGIKNDYISGDKMPGDKRLQTFNPLYPKGGYFGFDPQLGAANLVDLHPYGYMQLFTNCTLLADIVFNWRYSLKDGVYRPSGTFNLAGASSTNRYIGTAFLLKLAYRINRFLALDVGCHYFKTGPFVEDIISNHRNALLSNYRVVLKF